MYLSKHDEQMIKMAATYILMNSPEGRLLSLEEFVNVASEANKFLKPGQLEAIYNTAIAVVKKVQEDDESTRSEENNGH